MSRRGSLREPSNLQEQSTLQKLSDLRQRSRILRRPVFERIVFAQCWEDPRLDSQALQVRSGDTLLSVTSGGCNTLSLALQQPTRIIAADLNPAQNWLLELKMAGVRALGHAEYLEFLGVRPSRRRATLYACVRGELTWSARAFWDDHWRDIERGVLRCGKYERYLAAFRRLLILLHGRRKIARLFELRSLAERQGFYREEWDTVAWRLCFRLFFSRRILGLGLDPTFFTYVQDIADFGEHFRRLARHALVNLPAHDNYFLAQICLGRYHDETALPPYLLAENYKLLRQVVDCIEIVTGELGEILSGLPADSVDAFNLSNIFEWVSDEDFAALHAEIHRTGRPGARLCYRNLLVRRHTTERLRSQFQTDPVLAARLLRQDRSFVYSHFEVASVSKAGAN